MKIYSIRIDYYHYSYFINSFDVTIQYVVLCPSVGIGIDRIFI